MAHDFEQIENFLSRWSRRKLDKVASEPAPQGAPSAPQGAPSGPPAIQANTPSAEAAPPAELPSVESLTPESDFRPFMRPDVEPGVKRAALKQLFKDPHFNVMDGLDTYIDDYSVEDPIPPELMKTLYQAREHLFSPEEKAAADAVDRVAAEKVAADAVDATGAATAAALPASGAESTTSDDHDRKDA